MVILCSYMSSAPLSIKVLLVCKQQPSVSLLVTKVKLKVPYFNVGCL